MPKNRQHAGSVRGDSVDTIPLPPPGDLSPGQTPVHRQSGSAQHLLHGQGSGREDAAGEPAGCDAVTVFIRSPAPETVRPSRMTGCFADVARRAPLSTSMGQVNVGFRSLLGHDPQAEEALSCLRPAKGNAVLRGGPRHGAATGEPALFAVLSVALAGRREPGPAVRDHLPGAGGAVIVPLRQRPTRRC